MTKNDNAAGEKIKQFINRIERLEDEKSGVNEDIKKVYAELKSDGFDVKVIRKIVADRKDLQKAREVQELYDIYTAAIGM